MENAGKEDMPDDAERKGIGTPATRSGIIEKLVSSCFVERRKAKKITNLLPTSTGTALITVLPEQLQSPQLTAEWEHRLKEIERGEITPDSFTGRILENFYYIFNDERPGDFVGHSLSVSDIVALKQDGKVSYHYCDSMGFQELPAFQKPENYLKAAEMSMEDDYGMIDGIINNGPKQPTVADLEAQVKAGMSISLMDLAEAAHREKKKSVLEQLKSQPAQERPHKTAPKKSAEKEL